MPCKKSPLSVLLFIWCFVFTAGITSKSKFVVRKNKRINAMEYGEAVAQSTATCSAVCQSSSDCTAANFFAETKTCHLFNKACFLPEDASGWNLISRSPAYRTFQPITDLQTWDGAKSYCESIGGGLANIYTPADHDMILSVLGQSLDKDGLWLGGSDILSEGEWIWSNGCRFNDQDFQFWIPGEPNNDGNQDCLRLREDQRIKGWDDVGCTDLLKFVCEITVA